MSKNYLYKEKIVLVPSIVVNSHETSHYCVVDVDVLDESGFSDYIQVDKRLIIEPTEEQLAEIERYV